MPYVPPHLRPGYTHVAPKPVDYSGRVHWPTNINTHRQTNVIESDIRYSPRPSTKARLTVQNRTKHQTHRTHRRHKPSKKTRTRRH